MSEKSKSESSDKIILFSLDSHPLQAILSPKLSCLAGNINQRQFPDGESYLRIDTPVAGKHCIVLAELSYPNHKYLPLVFLVNTLREFGAASVGLLAPYLCYMRQDRRFQEGEAITSKIFAADLCQHIDWLVTVDPHLHRYHSLDEIYTIPTRVVQGAPALVQWLGEQHNVFLVGPDAESEQWVAEIARCSGHPYVIGDKQRLGDRSVQISLPSLEAHQNKAAVIVDDVISSGQTILQCLLALQQRGIESIKCAAIHGIFVDDIDRKLLEAGLAELIACNTIPHRSNVVDVSSLLVQPVLEFIEKMEANA